MSGSYLCLSCWRTVLQSEAYYTCPSCGSSDDPFAYGDDGPRPVKELRRGFWHWLNRQQAPRCPWHPEAALQLYCDGCQSELRSSLRLCGDKPTGMGLVGSRASGKSTLLVAMIDTLNKSFNHVRREVSLSPVGDTAERFQKISRRLLREKRLPPPTPRSHDGRGHFAWEVLVSDRPGRTYGARLLSIYDTAGETWEKLTGEDSSCLDRYLSKLTSLTLLVDGASVAADLRLDESWGSWLGADESEASDLQVLGELRDRLGEQTSRRLRLALAVSKLDLIWNHEPYQALNPSQNHGGLDRRQRDELIRKLLIDSGRKPLIMAAENHFQGVRTFGVSSFGFHPGKPGPDGEIRLTRNIHPEGVVELLLWLIDVPGVADR